MYLTKETKKKSSTLRENTGKQEGQIQVCHCTQPNITHHKQW
jgi:hypothetical protein